MSRSQFYIYSEEGSLSKPTMFYNSKDIALYDFSEQSKKYKHTDAILFEFEFGQIYSMSNPTHYYCLQNGHILKREYKTFMDKCMDAFLSFGRVFRD